MVGRTVSHYRIIEKLGEGGMGVVYKAEDTKLKRTVALKFLPPAALDDLELRARFLHEAQAAAGLSHPNICAVHDMDEESGFLVMEYVEGETVQAHLRRRPLPLADALDIATQAAQGLQAAHEHGVVHRDVKSANLIVTPEGNVKIMDFGLARSTRQAHVTKTGVVAGTPAYMSPEQARGKAVDRRADLWSLGVVLYEMVTGRVPFRGEGDAATIHGILNADPEPVTALRSGLPLELDHVIGKALEKDPQLRYQSAAEMRADLRRLQRDSVPTTAAVFAPSIAVPRRKRNLPWRAAGIAVGALALAAIGVVVWQRIRAAPLTDKDVLVLADFTNTTGDSVFDTTLREALAVQLEQSPFLKILSDEQVRQDLGFMGRSPSERITTQLAREICQRENDKAMIGGSIANLDKTYIVTLQATNCQTGESLVREQIQAQDKDQVLRALAKATTRVRAKLGESLASIQKLAVLPERVTTPSLEAFQAFALGRVRGRLGLSLDAIPFFRRATELDPNFAAAYMSLSGVYLNLGDRGLCAEMLRKAFALVDRVSELERLTITASYYYNASGELDKAAEAFQLLARTYPRNAGLHNSLGLVYDRLDEREKALAEYQEAARLDPGMAFPYSNQVHDSAVLDRFDEAKAVAEKALARELDFSTLHFELLLMAFVQRDQAEAEKQIQWQVGKPDEYRSLRIQAANANVLGQFRRRRELVRSAAEMASRRNLPGVAGRFRAADAWDEALLGNCQMARTLAPSGKTTGLAPVETLNAAMPLALCGDRAAAQKEADDASKRYPLDTIWKAVQLPSIQAAIELNGNQPEKAIELLRSAAPYERNNGYALYLRGLAYLRSQKGSEAAGEFQKILDHKFSNWALYYALSHVGLGRAATLAGDTPRARKAYQDFLTLWKNADPEIPILNEAKAEYAKLN